LALLASRKYDPIVLLAVRFVIKNVMANANVMVKLPVTFIPKGINPKIFKNKQRKDSQQITHVFLYVMLSPMFGIAISSRINNTTGSKILPPPVAIPPFLE
jgi:hypothetical protein